MMRYRKFGVLGIICVWILFLALPAQASEYRFVFDEAEFLTEEEVLSMEDMAYDVSMRYGCGVYIATTWDYSNYGETVFNAAENFYGENGLGIGNDGNGVLLFLSMADRDYALIAHGQIGNAVFTDSGMDALSQSFLNCFYYDDWPGGLNGYISKSEQLLESAAVKDPADMQQAGGVGLTLIMVVLIPAVIAGVSCGIMAGAMKTARSKTHADDYRREVQITDRYDRFITRTVVRQKLETSSSSSGRTKVKSGGFSGKSGKF